MKRSALTLLGAFTGAISHAAAVNWGAAIDTGLLDTSAAALATGNTVRIGYFQTFTDAQITANALTPGGINLLNADFKQFGSSTIGVGTSSAGSFSEASSPFYSSLPGFSPSSQIYFWALKSNNLNDPLNTVIQTAIAYVPFADISSWRFPASDSSPPLTIDLNDLSNSNAKVLAGSYISSDSAALTPVFGNPNRALKLSNVPEPSTLGLAIFGAFCFLSARPRRQNG